MINRRIRRDRKCKKYAQKRSNEEIPQREKDNNFIGEIIERQNNPIAEPGGNMGNEYCFESLFTKKKTSERDNIDIEFKNELEQRDQNKSTRIIFDCVQHDIIADKLRDSRKDEAAQKEKDITFMKELDIWDISDDKG